MRDLGHDAGHEKGHAIVVLPAQMLPATGRNIEGGAALSAYFGATDRVVTRTVACPPMGVVLDGH